MDVLLCFCSQFTGFPTLVNGNISRAFTIHEALQKCVAHSGGLTALVATEKLTKQTQRVQELPASDFFCE